MFVGVTEIAIVYERNKFDSCVVGRSISNADVCVKPAPTHTLTDTLASISLFL